MIYEISHLLKGVINFIGDFLNHFLNELLLKVPLLSCRRTQVLKLEAADLEYEQTGSERAFDGLSSLMNEVHGLRDLPEL